MSDLPPPSTGATTELSGVVTPSTTTTTPSTPASVSPAQTIVDTSALIAQYESRIRNLMSEKDKAINERNQAITQLTELQQQHTTLQEQTQSSLTGAANAAQQAIDRSKSLEGEIARLQGEALRAQTLLEKPHLAPYAQFIPASSDPEAVKKAVEQLEAIRNQDLERNRALVQGAGQFATPPQPTPPPAAGQINPLALYQNRPNMSPSFAGMPGSTPAQMNPGAMTDPLVSIQQLFDDAKRSGDPSAFEKALEQSQLLARTSIDQQMGRSPS